MGTVHRKKRKNTKTKRKKKGGNPSGIDVTLKYNDTGELIEHVIGEQLDNDAYANRNKLYPVYNDESLFDYNNIYDKTQAFFTIPGSNDSTTNVRRINIAINDENDMLNATVLNKMIRRFNAMRNKNFRRARVMSGGQGSNVFFGGAKTGVKEIDVDPTDLTDTMTPREREIANKQIQSGIFSKAIEAYGITPAFTTSKSTRNNSEKNQVHVPGDTELSKEELDNQSPLEGRNTQVVVKKPDSSSPFFTPVPPPKPPRSPKAIPSPEVKGTSTKSSVAASPPQAPIQAQLVRAHNKVVETTEANQEKTDEVLKKQEDLQRLQTEIKERTENSQKQLSEKERQIIDQKLELKQKQEALDKINADAAKLQAEKASFETKENELKQQVAKAHAELNAVSTEKTELQKRIEGNEKLLEEHVQLILTNSSKTDAEKAQFKADIDRLTKEITTATKSLASLSAEKKALESNTADLQNKLHKTEKEAATSVTELAKLKEDITKTKAALDKKNTDVEKLQAEKTSLEKNKNELRENLAKAQAELNSVTTKTSEEKNDLLDTIRKDKQILDVRLKRNQKLSTELTTLKDQQTALEREHADLQKKLQDTETAANTTVTKLKEEIATANSNLDAINKKNAELEKRIQENEEQLVIRADQSIKNATEKDDLLKILSNLREDIKTKETETALLQTQIQSLTQNNSVKDEANRKLNEEITQLRERIQQEKDNLIGANTKTAQEKAAMQNSIDQMQNDLDSRAQTISDNQQMIQKNTEELEKLRLQMGEQKALSDAETASLNTKIQTLTQNNNKKDEANNMLNVEIAQLKETIKKEEGKLKLAESDKTKTDKQKAAMRTKIFDMRQILDKRAKTISENEQIIQQNNEELQNLRTKMDADKKTSEADKAQLMKNLKNAEDQLNEVAIQKEALKIQISQKQAEHETQRTKLQTEIERIKQELATQTVEMDKLQDSLKNDIPMLEKEIERQKAELETKEAEKQTAEKALTDATVEWNAVKAGLETQVNDLTNSSSELQEKLENANTKCEEDINTLRQQVRTLEDQLAEELKAASTRTRQAPQAEAPQAQAPQAQAPQAEQGTPDSSPEITQQQDEEEDDEFEQLSLVNLGSKKQATPEGSPEETPQKPWFDSGVINNQTPDQSPYQTPREAFDISESANQTPDQSPYQTPREAFDISSQSANVAQQLIANIKDMFTNDEENEKQELESKTAEENEKQELKNKIQELQSQIAELQSAASPPVNLPNINANKSSSSLTSSSDTDLLNMTTEERQEKYKKDFETDPEYRKRVLDEFTKQLPQFKFPEKLPVEDLLKNIQNLSTKLENSSDTKEKLRLEEELETLTQSLGTNPELLKKNQEENETFLNDIIKPWATYSKLNMKMFIPQNIDKLTIQDLQEKGGYSEKLAKRFLSSDTANYCRKFLQESGKMVLKKHIYDLKTCIPSKSDFIENVALYSSLLENDTQLPPNKEEWKTNIFNIIKKMYNDGNIDHANEYTNQIPTVNLLTGFLDISYNTDVTKKEEREKELKDLWDNLPKPPNYRPKITRQPVVKPQVLPSQNTSNESNTSPVTTKTSRVVVPSNLLTDLGKNISPLKTSTIMPPTPPSTQEQQPQNTSSESNTASGATPPPNTSRSTPSAVAQGPPTQPQNTISSNNNTKNALLGALQKQNKSKTETPDSKQSVVPNRPPAQLGFLNAIKARKGTLDSPP
jgi:chromosome segregation ATPase